MVVDISRQAEKNPDYNLQLSDIRGWEKLHGRIPGGAIVLIRSGWGKYWRDRKRYFGTDVAGDTDNLHFPGLDPEVAKFLVKERRIKAVGIDTPSIDHGPSRQFLTHQILAGANLAIFENVANLDRLPARRATVYAIPMKIKGAAARRCGSLRFSHDRPRPSWILVRGVALWADFALRFCFNWLNPIGFAGFRKGEGHDWALS